MSYQILLCFIVLIWVQSTFASTTEDWQAEPFDDRALSHDLEYPTWFKASFLDLREDIQDAKQQQKLGIIVYFGQQRCPYCHYMLNINWGEKNDIVEYTKRYFDVIAIDIWGQLSLTTPDGVTTNESNYAQQLDARFTPSLVFFDTNGKEIFRLRGYYPPYQFRAALDYVVGGYYTQQNFSQYLDSVDTPQRFDLEGLNSNPLFMAPPYLLQRNHLVAERVLAVLFEQGLCHACDLFHSAYLSLGNIQRQLEKLELIQLDILADTPVQTPDGNKLTAKQWAKTLNIFYTPSLVFFDPQGQEIMRLDSISGLNRLHAVLDYVASGDYAYFTYQDWQAEQRKICQQLLIPHE